MESLGTAAILVVGNEEIPGGVGWVELLLSSSNRFLVEVRELELLPLPSEKTAATTWVAKSATDEMS